MTNCWTEAGEKSFFFLPPFFFNAQKWRFRSAAEVKTYKGLEKNNFLDSQKNTSFSLNHQH